MDFALTDEQRAIVELAAQILGDRCTPERLKEVEGGSEWFDRDLWAQLAKADLLGITLPESDGGGGFGFLELALLQREAGRVVAPVPLGPTLVAAAAVAALGDEAQRARWLPGVADGTVVLAPALVELDAPVTEPHLTAESSGDGWVLRGSKTIVPAAHVADALVVSARDNDGRSLLFLVPTDAAGLSHRRQDTFNHEPRFHCELADVEVGPEALVGGGDDGAVAWLVERATVASCAFVAGLADRCMRITAEYVTGRKQFDRPIGSFQAVGHRMADCYVDNESINLSMLAAASKLHDGTPAASEVQVARYWASSGGSRIAHAGLHLHGGISIDLDYPIHRYFLTLKHLEFEFGPATQQLAWLGRHLADTPV